MNIILALACIVPLPCWGMEGYRTRLVLNFKLFIFSKMCWKKEAVKESKVHHHKQSVQRITPNFQFSRKILLLPHLPHIPPVLHKLGWNTNIHGKKEHTHCFLWKQTEFQLTPLKVDYLSKKLTAVMSISVVCAPSHGPQSFGGAFNYVFWCVYNEKLRLPLHALLFLDGTLKAL